MRNLKDLENMTLGTLENMYNEKFGHPVGDAPYVLGCCRYVELLMESIGEGKDILKEVVEGGGK